MSRADDRSIYTDKICRYFGDLKAVDGVDLAVRSGEIFGFLGPNGSGKSTLVNVLATILLPTSGTARVAGHDVRQEGELVRAAIGVALQDVGLDPLMSAREMLILQARLFGLTREAARNQAERLLHTVGLDDVDPRKRVGQYSGGMRRRLDLAMALVHDPRVLFLDEPTTGLDPASRVAVWEEVRRLNRQEGMTIFLTTQYLEEADRLADRVGIINRGRIVAEGSPGELKRVLGNEVVTLTFASSEIALRASEVLAEVVPQRQVSGHEVLCYLSAAAPVIAEVVRRLDAAGVALGGLVISRPTLDDVFLQATGERLRAEAADSEATGEVPAVEGIGG